MKFNVKVIIIALVAAVPGFAQDQVAQQYGNMITPADLKENLSILASDAMEGRETGKRGQKMAAAFIRAHFEEVGLTPPVQGNYYQPVELFASVPGEIYMAAGNTKFQNYDAILYYGNSDSGGEITLPTVFVGKGKEEDFNKTLIKSMLTEKRLW
jgi:hypothetical protein